MLFTQQIFILNIKEDGADFLSRRCDVDKTFADKEDDLRSEEIYSHSHSARFLFYSFSRIAAEKRWGSFQDQ